MDYFFRNFFLPYPASPTNPRPRRSMVAGSGKGTPEAGAMNSKTAVKMIENMNHDCFAYLLIFMATSFELGQLLGTSEEVSGYSRCVNFPKP